MLETESRKKEAQLFSEHWNLGFYVIENILVELDGRMRDASYEEGRMFETLATLAPSDTVPTPMKKMGNYDLIRKNTFLMNKEENIKKREFEIWLQIYCSAVRGTGCSSDTNTTIKNAANLAKYAVLEHRKNFG